MHNLFLGLAKHTVKVWRDIGIISSSDLVLIQERVDSMKPPPKVGRIPRKIASGFYSFTADEWKNFILLYSVYALHGIIPQKDYDCWCLFVQACVITCQLILTRQDITTAHELLVQFCKKFTELYGRECCTPNMHMACHISENMHDYGPLAAFWAFSFERYNGILENLKLSWCGPEKQMLKKFLSIQSQQKLQNKMMTYFLNHCIMI